MCVRSHGHALSPWLPVPLDVRRNAWTSFNHHRSPNRSHSDKLPINFRLVLWTHAAIPVETFLFLHVHRVWSVPSQVTAVTDVWPAKSPQRYPHAAHRCAVYMHTSSTDSSTDPPGWKPRERPKPPARQFPADTDPSPMEGPLLAVLGHDGSSLRTLACPQHHQRNPPLQSQHHR